MTWAEGIQSAGQSIGAGIGDLIRAQQERKKRELAAKALNIDPAKYPDMYAAVVKGAIHPTQARQQIDEDEKNKVAAAKAQTASQAQGQEQAAIVDQPASQLAQMEPTGMSSMQRNANAGVMLGGTVEQKQNVFKDMLARSAQMNADKKKRDQEAAAAQLPQTSNVIDRLKYKAALDAGLTTEQALKFAMPAKEPKVAAEKDQSSFNRQMDMANAEANAKKTITPKAFEDRARAQLNDAYQQQMNTAKADTTGGGWLKAMQIKPPAESEVQTLARQMASDSTGVNLSQAKLESMQKNPPGSGTGANLDARAAELRARLDALRQRLDALQSGE